jgi:CRP-like cAMP-binding protein
VGAGDIVVREGEERGPAAAEAYIVRSGEFELLQARGGDTVRVDVAKRGDCVGEVGGGVGKLGC